MENNKLYNQITTCICRKNISDCQVYAVGKPVFHHSSNDTYGSWMRDPQPHPQLGNETVWITREHEHTALYEFVNKTTFTQDKHSTKYHLPIPFSVSNKC